MASGTIGVSTSNSNISGRIIWSSSSNGSAANTSNVTATLQYYRGDGYQTYGTFSGGINIGGSTKSVSLRITLKSANGWVTVGSYTRTINHNPDGSGIVWIGGSGGISGSSFSSSSGGETVSLDKIPRYTSVTSWDVTEVGQTYVKFNWETADNINFARVYLNNNSQHTDIPGAVSGKSGSFTYIGMTSGNATIPPISTLEPGTTYNLKIQVRRADSGLWTTSNNKSFTTIPIATITNTDVSFNIGSNIILNFINYEKNPFYLALDIQNIDGTWDENVVTVDEVLNVESYTWNLSESSVILYQKVTTRNSANIRIRCGTTIGEQKKEHIVNGVMYVVNSNPSFSTYSYGNASTDINNVLGKTSYMPAGYGDMQVHISTANKAIPKNFATITNYVATVYNSSEIAVLTKIIPYNGSSQVDISFGSFNDEGIYTIKIHAVDSRGNLSDVISKTFYILDYHKPQVEILKLERQNGYEESTTITINALYSKLAINSINKNSSFTIKYRYAITGNSFDNTYYEVRNLVSSSYNDNDMKVITSPSDALTINLLSSNTYDFEFIMADKINSIIIKTSVGQGVPIMAQADNGIVSVGVVPDFSSTELLQVGSDVMATDTDGAKVGVLSKINQINDDLSNKLLQIDNNFNNLIDKIKPVYLGNNEIGINTGAWQFMTNNSRRIGNKIEFDFRIYTSIIVANNKYQIGIIPSSICPKKETQLVAIAFDANYANAVACTCYIEYNTKNKNWVVWLSIPSSNRNYVNIIGSYYME